METALFSRPDYFTAPDTTREAREFHSKKIDLDIGFRIDQIENDLLLRAKALRPDGTLWGLGQALHQGHQTWVGLDPQSIQTPYDELRVMFELIQFTGTETVVDLGAAYGRMGIVLHALYPQAQFQGYEFVRERVEEGKRIYRSLGISGKLEVADLTDKSFVLPDAEVYFIYDFGDLPMIRILLDQLSLRAHKKFKLIARGKGSRGLIDYEYPWLSDVFPVIRTENFAIYSSFL